MLLRYEAFMEGKVSSARKVMLAPCSDTEEMPRTELSVAAVA